MAPLMPDVRNTTEVAAAAAMLAAGFSPTLQIILAGAVGDGWNDADDVGTNARLADTVGADGTISYQMLEPGEDHGLYVDQSYITVNIWGMDSRVYGYLTVTLEDWGDNPASTYFGTEPLPHDEPNFLVQLWSLHHPDNDAELLATLDQFADLSVTIRKNDTREARVTISQFDPKAVHCVPFEFSLRVWYGDYCVFWAPANCEDDYGNGTVLISGVDALKLQHHYVRIGDDVLTDIDPDTGLRDDGFITRDHRGLAGLLAAAQNTEEQDARNMASLGISEGFFGDAETESGLSIQRGQEVFELMKSISDNATGPDWMLVPNQAADGSGGAYMQLDVVDQYFWGQQDNVNFYFNKPGLADNIESLTHTPGIPVTHAHVLSQDTKYRVTAADLGSSQKIGAYVQWNAENFNVKDDNTDALEAIAEAIVQVYGKPLKNISITLRPDAGQVSYYNELQTYDLDFSVGAVVHIEATNGYRSVEGDFQIYEVTLAQSSWRGNPQTDLNVSPWLDVEVGPEE